MREEIIKIMDDLEKALLDDLAKNTLLSGEGSEPRLYVEGVSELGKIVGEHRERILKEVDEVCDQKRSVAN